MEVLMLGASTSASDWLQAIGNYAWVFLGVGFVIFVHELGHFLVAKACGVKCEKFYIGFDAFDINLGFIKIPAALYKVQWGETEYGIGLIPLGGYVKMLGQDDNPNNAEEEAKRTQSADGKVDPRSYTAKTVPQRMAIISAGVIMNIIFGFIFAVIAYYYGVDEIPAVAGGTSAGDPAWQAGILPGDRIIQIGKQGHPNEHLRFSKDMLLQLALYGNFKDPIDILVRDKSGKEVWHTLQPSDRLKNAKESRPTIGMIMPDSNTVRTVIEEMKPFVPTAMHEFSSGDVITSINSHPVSNGADIPRILARNYDQPITLQMLKKSKNSAEKDTAPKQYSVTIDPLPMRDFGIVMKAEPIHAIQVGSVADKAGFKVGDRILKMNDKFIEDPLSFPQQTLKLIGQTANFVVERDKQELDIPVELQEPQQCFWQSVAGNSVVVETLGIAYKVQSTVEKVTSAGPAENKLHPGDELLSFTFIPANEAAGKIHKLFIDDPHKTKIIDNKQFGWPVIVKLATLLPNVNLQLEVKRGEKTETIKLESVASTTTFNETRGIPIRLLEETHIAANFSEAMSLGLREMKERMQEVLAVLRKLFSGGAKLNGLAGPLTIFQVAASESSRGLPELLLFLTMLSANLAIMNFLPIPVLDGGHMVFLTYEGLTGRKVNENLQGILSLIGLILLLSLMAFVLFLDIDRWFL